MGYGTAVKMDLRPAALPVITPCEALVISRVSTTSASILTQHRILDGALDEGRLVGAEQLPEVLRSLGLSGGIDWVDERVLASGMGGIAWYQPGAVRPMYWRLNSTSVTLRVKWPTLVFVMSYAGRFRVFATEDSKRPGPRTPLFHAPLGNIYQDGSMCWGNIPTPGFSARNRNAFESGVYDTYFTKPNHAAAVTNGAEDLFAVWKKAGLKGIKRQQLSPLRENLDSILNEQP